MVSRAREGRRIALLGGTFDPPHIGHLIVAEAARVALELDEVRFVVAGMPWMKSSVSPARDRFAMVQLAVADNLFFVADASESDRPGPTFTVDTLRTVALAEPDAAMFFLLGADAAQMLPKWHDIDACLGLATFVVVGRMGYATGDGPFDDRLLHVEVPLLDISSTELRSRFAAGTSVRYLVPADVERYVREHGLYGATDDED